LGGQQRISRRWEGAGNTLPLPQISVGFIGCPGRSLVTIPTKLSQLIIITFIR